MKVLIIGSGGREHALAWKVAQSPRVGQVFVAPGNAGTRLEPRTTNVDIAADDVEGLLEFARRERIDLTIVGPEGPLVLGLCDEFAAAGLRCYGPSRLAARLEGSKAFTKDFLRRHGIPTAAYGTFTRETFDAAWIRSQQAPLVVKADGLAAGKGVVICATQDEAVATAQDMFSGRFGKAGRRGRGRGISRGRGSELHRDGGRHQYPAARHVAGPQAAARRRRGPEHRRHGCLFARAGRDAGDPRPDHGRSHATHRGGARAGGHPLRGFPVRRRHDRPEPARHACSNSIAVSAIPRRSRSWPACAPTSFLCARPGSMAGLPASKSTGIHALP